MFIVELMRDIEGLGKAGSLVVADKNKIAKQGEWSVVYHDEGISCVRWDEGMPRGYPALRVVS